MMADSKSNCQSGPRVEPSAGVTEQTRAEEIEPMRPGAGPRRRAAAAHGQASQIRTALGGRSIVLIGLMGAGKSAIGRRLAAALDLSFVDADAEIETAAGKNISDIFADHGEPYFREGERRVIARLLGGGQMVLATGGGAYMCEETRATIKERGVSIWIKADLPVLLARVARRDNRPLLQNGDPAEIMQELMRTRHPVYAQSDLTVESRDVPHDTIVAEIMSVLAGGSVAKACGGPE